MDRQQVERAIRESRSYRQAAKLLGTNHAAVKRLSVAFEIDTSHFDFGRRYTSMVNREFNLLTIRDVFTEDRRKWFCRCDCRCGTTNIVKRIDGVISGRTPSCGCTSRSHPTVLGSQNPAFTGCGDLHGSRVYWIRRYAERREIPFEVTKEYLWALFEAQEKRCALSGVDLHFGRMHFSHETNASLDRIDSAKGYVEGNVQWVHKHVNKIKRDLDQDYFLLWCRRISDHSHTRTPPRPTDGAE